MQRLRPAAVDEAEAFKRTAKALRDGSLVSSMFVCLVCIDKQLVSILLSDMIPEKWYNMLDWKNLFLPSSH